MYRNRELDRFERDWGVVLPGAMDYLKPEWKRDFQMAMDAQPSLISTASAGIPSFLSTFIDPDILRIVTAKNKAVEIFGEVKKGDWLQKVAMFPVVEHTGEPSTYGDFSKNGRANANAEFEARESYLYQVIVEYGERELEMAGLARIGWASELKQAQVSILNKFQNLTYFYGVQGLQCYGILNAPGLNAPISPAVKQAGGVSWFNGTVPNATANEVYNDIIALATQLVNQSNGDIDEESELVLALSPRSSMALTFANSYNVSVRDLIEKNYKRLKIVTAIQYGAQTASNPQGNVAGEIVQLIAPTVNSQKTGFCAFTEKLRAHAIIRDDSSFRQKMTQGTWGAVIRQPYAIAQLLGV